MEESVQTTYKEVFVERVQSIEGVPGGSGNDVAATLNIFDP